RAGRVQRCGTGRRADVEPAPDRRRAAGGWRPDRPHRPDGPGGARRPDGDGYADGRGRRPRRPPAVPVPRRAGRGRADRGAARVVIEFAGDGVPGWRSEYVTEAVAAGRGDRIEIDADAVLAVDITGTRYPEEGEGHYAPLGPLDGKDVIEEVHYVGTFEGVTQ